MITKIDIIAFAKHAARAGSTGSHTRLTHPMRDWWTGVAAAAIVCAGLSAYAGSLFVMQVGGTDSMAAAQDAGVSYDEGRIARIQDALDARSRKFGALREEAPAALMETSSEASSTPAADQSTSTAPVE
jgi:urocanate hydratase